MYLNAQISMPVGAFGARKSKAVGELQIMATIKAALKADQMQRISK